MREGEGEGKGGKEGDREGEKRGRESQSMKAQDVWKQGGPLCFLLGSEGPWLPGRACDGFTREEMEA